MKWMSWMRRIVGRIKPRTGFILLGVLALVLLIWLGGPMLALGNWRPLETVAGRLVFLLLLVAGVLGYLLWRQRRQRQNNEKVVKDMMAASESDELLREEVRTQREKMRQALSLVRQWKPGRFRSVYELPWYMIIGAPGSGKSTALLNSGLEFPLKEEMGIDAVRGVGGTRYCDWWFTNKAVIIDTAGRYTTQESADRRDSRGWKSFLGLLKKYRARQPINGVILSISIADLLEQTPTERVIHARALKQRVQELRNRLGVVFPVYVLLTKADLLEGFGETFGMLSDEEREKALGMTFELESVRDPSRLSDVFEQEFDDLRERLSRFAIHRMQQEHHPSNHRRIYQFPKQLALLQAPVWTLIKEVFYPSAYEDTPLLRGIYLVSSEQGSPAYDKVSELVDDQFRLTPANRPKSTAVTSRDGFFLRDLFENIVFAEHRLVGVDGTREKRQTLLRHAAMVVMGVATVAVGLAWYGGYQWNQTLIDQYEDGTNELSGRLDGGVNDWLRLNEFLSRAAALPGVQDEPLPEGRVFHLGLNHSDTLAQSAEGAYGRLLQHYFGGALRNRLESQARQNFDNPEYLYETLKTYLMLIDRDRLDPDQVIAWFDLQLQQQLPGAMNEEARASLHRHLREYLHLDHSMPADRELIAAARDELTSQPLDERAYQRIQLDASQSRFPDFRLPMVLGSVAERVFERRSGASLRDGIPALYTLNGYRGIFEPARDEIVSRLLEDLWVYGEDAGDYRNLDEDQLRAGVEDRYFRDYIHHWERYLSDLRVRSFSDVSDAENVASLLSSADAPLARLKAAVQYNTELRPPDEDGNASDALNEMAEGARDQLDRRTGRMGRLMPLASAPSDDEDGSTPVDQAFQAIHEIDDAVFEELQSHADKMAIYFEEERASRPRALRTLERNDFDAAVRDFYRTVNDSGSEILQGMLSNYVADARRFVQASETQNVNEIWRNQVYAEYRQAIEGRYPVEPNAEDDISLSDFAQFFGYGGTLDRFFAEHLEGHVDTSRSPWRLTGDIRIRQTSLRMLEHAYRIRQAFFEPGSDELAVGFSLKPAHLDSEVSRMRVDINGESLVYRHGPSRSMRFQWPAPDGDDRTTLSLATSEEREQQRWHGPWSVFRMLQDAGGMEGQGRQRELEFRLNGYEAGLELEADSVRHPFHRSLIAYFRLPSRL